MRAALCRPQEAEVGWASCVLGQLVTSGIVASELAGRVWPQVRTGGVGDPLLALRALHPKGGRRAAKAKTRLCPAA